MILNLEAGPSIGTKETVLFGSQIIGPVNMAVTGLSIACGTLTRNTALKK
jgi:hypothetical protein